MSDEVYYCPKCDHEMQYVGGLLEYSCPNCGAEGSLEYDGVNKEYYVFVESTVDVFDIMQDPEGNKPPCCDACGGPYPDCLTSCKIFDD